MRMTRVVCCAALALAACGGGDDVDSAGDGGASASGTEEQSGGDGSTFEGELEDGSTLLVRLDVDVDDPAVAPFEAFRADAGAPEVTWIVGEVTVPDGADGTGRFISFVGEGLDPIDDDPEDDADGITNAEFACSELDEWSTAAADPEAIADAYLALYEGPCASQTLQVVAPAGETTTYVMAYEGELPEFERVFAGLATELTPA